MKDMMMRYFIVPILLLISHVSSFQNFYHSNVINNNVRKHRQHSGTRLFTPLQQETERDDIDQFPESSSSFFVSKPTQLYIEDTDAYGVMYNGNYIKFYERALSDHLLHKSHNEKKCSSSSSYYSYHECTKHKFKSSPTLGGKFIIRGTKQLCDDFKNNKEKESWSLEMLEYNLGDDKEKSINIDNGALDKMKVHNTAIVTISKKYLENPRLNDEIIMMDSKKQQKQQQQQHHTVSKEFTVYRDELYYDDLLPLQTILNFFERVRTEALGGPNRLRQLKEEENLLWVVTSIDELISFPYRHHFHGQEDINGGFFKDDDYDDDDMKVKPGDDLIVRMVVTPKRRGMFLICKQEILKRGTKCNGDDDNNKGVENAILLAKGIVTVCAINAQSNRPTSNLPDSLKVDLRKIGLEI